jgi:hypothetical protein
MELVPAAYFTRQVGGILLDDGRYRDFSVRIGLHEHMAGKRNALSGLPENDGAENRVLILGAGGKNGRREQGAQDRGKESRRSPFSAK